MSIKNMKLVRKKRNYIDIIEYKNNKKGDWTVYKLNDNKWEKITNYIFDFDDEIGNDWEEYFYTMLAISDEWQAVSGDVELDNNDDDYE